MKTENDQQENNEPQATKIALASREMSTTSQINSLLSVAGTMMNTLDAMLRKEDGIPPSGPGGDIYLAASTTFVKACNVLDDVMEQKNRWQCKERDELEAKMKEQLEAQKAAYDAQRRKVELQTAPHLRYHPSLSRLKNEDGEFEPEWVAIIGRVEDPENAIMGVGTSPEEALANFDEAFRGNTRKAIEAFVNRKGLNKQQPKQKDKE